MEETQKIQDKKTNAKLFPIYKMFSWDLLFYYSIIYLFLTQAKNFSASEVLLAESFFTASCLFLQIPIGLLVDKFGKKMSKSKGNIVSPFKTIETYGADTIRFYLPYTSPVWTPIKFDEEGLKEIYSKYINTFKNTYSFFEMYANADNIDPREYNIDVEKRDITDKWLISKLNKLIKEVTSAYEEYDLTKVTKAIIVFLNDDLSNWYIRSNRRRFWESELTESKKAVYLTTYEVLLTLTKLTAPITPYISEEIYKCLTNKESVHLEDFPKYDDSLINESIEKQMDLIRDICSLGRFAREEAKIKVRQPISELILDSNDEKTIGNLQVIIKEELNVKNIIFIKDMDKYMEYIVKPNFREVGKLFGPKVNMFAETLKTLSHDEISKLRNEEIEIVFDGSTIKVVPNMVDINVKVKEGYCSSNNGKTFVILNTELTDELILEGIARELIRKIQSMRKEMDLVITDRINVYYNGPEKLEETLLKYSDFIKNETLTRLITKDENLKECFDINDINVYLKIEKA